MTQHSNTDPATSPAEVAHPTSVCSERPVVSTVALRTAAPTSPISLVPACRFTYEELVTAYNQTRVDYIVPMPMNAARLREYVHTYDVDMEASVVAIEDEQILGLAMLGVRPGHTWVTRLGVLPVKRRRGIGRLLMEHLIAYSRVLNVPYVTLDVIKHNDPAYYLFLKLGFYDVRELLVVRRPPGPPSIHVSPYVCEVLDGSRAVELLQRRRDAPSWLNETASLVNGGSLAALRVELTSGDWGWLVYQITVFQLSRLVVQAEAGEPHQVALALLHALHQRHPMLDTKVENLPLDSPYWPAMREMGYLESFRRIEMRLDLCPSGDGHFQK
ncbi:MAG: GNAT family N-acetyltransferase [Anaerolineae bacterium]|nr:GNAT family N-acetyltransferase [Anaerolineae bacterium]